VDFSIRYLLERFDALGACRQELEVKLFGGADVLPVSAVRAHIATVGAMNCKVALEVLEKEGLRVVASDLGGLKGRTIHFDTGTGEVLVRRLARLRVSEAHRRDDAEPARRRKDRP
jgi:chemotaxis protein CheD